MINTLNCQSNFLPSNQNTIFKNTAKMNNATFYDYINRFKKIATSVFEWVNLPESCDERWLELCLFYFGKASFLYDNNLGFINTQAIPGSELNIYGLPTLINCWSFSYNTTRRLYTGLKNYKRDEEKEDDECILIMNNYDMIPTMDTIQLFAYRLYEVERTIDINLKTQKTPYILAGDKNSIMTLKNIFQKYDGNEPVMFVDKQFFANEGNSIACIKTDAPYLIDDLTTYKKSIWNEALTFLGINNIIEEKAERLITDEANSNNELINLNLESYMLTRKKACEQINKKFGLDVDVRVRSDLQNVIKNYNSSINDIKTGNEIEEEKIDKKEGVKDNE